MNKIFIQTLETCDIIKQRIVILQLPIVPLSIQLCYDFSKNNLANDAQTFIETHNLYMLKSHNLATFANYTTFIETFMNKLLTVAKQFKNKHHNAYYIVYNVDYNHTETYRLIHVYIIQLLKLIRYIKQTRWIVNNYLSSWAKPFIPIGSLYVFSRWVSCKHQLQYDLQTKYSEYFTKGSSNKVAFTEGSSNKVAFTEGSSNKVAFTESDQDLAFDFCLFMYGSEQLNSFCR